MKLILAALIFAASSTVAISITTPTTWTPAGEQLSLVLFDSCLNSISPRNQHCHVCVSFFTACREVKPEHPTLLRAFSSVRTDPASFAAILVNQDGNLVPTSITLKANVTTSTHTFTFTPSPKLLVGSGYQVNFIKNINSQHTIVRSTATKRKLLLTPFILQLAQTNMFNITAPAAPVICPSNNQGTIAVNRTDDGSPVGFISSKFSTKYQKYNYYTVSGPGVVNKAAAQIFSLPKNAASIQNFGIAAVNGPDPKNPFLAGTIIATGGPNQIEYLQMGSDAATILSGGTQRKKIFSFVHHASLFEVCVAVKAGSRPSSSGANTIGPIAVFLTNVYSINCKSLIISSQWINFDGSRSNMLSSVRPLLTDQGLLKKVHPQRISTMTRMETMETISARLQTSTYTISTMVHSLSHLALSPIESNCPSSVASASSYLSSSKFLVFSSSIWYKLATTHLAPKEQLRVASSPSFHLSCHQLRCPYRAPTLCNLPLSSLATPIDPSEPSRPPSTESASSPSSF
ncbi:hypothetical protein P7C70_g6966, partial [Phenoliferia sp. Uapishka_3]